MLQEGLEPPTLGLLDPCSTKLSYQSCAAHARDRTKDLQIFSLTLSQLSYMGVHSQNLWPMGQDLAYFSQKKTYVQTKIK